jgi:hypothetical protein
LLVANDPVHFFEIFRLTFIFWVNHQVRFKNDILKVRFS